MDKVPQPVPANSVRNAPGNRVHDDKAHRCRNHPPAAMQRSLRRPAPQSRSGQLPAPLRIEEEIALSEHGRKIMQTYRFMNPGKEPMRFSFKINNFPKIGSRFAGKEPLAGQTRISCGTLSYVPGVPKNERLFLASPDAAPELRRHLVFGRMPVEKVIPGPVTSTTRSISHVCSKRNIRSHRWNTAGSSPDVQPEPAGEERIRGNRLIPAFIFISADKHNAIQGFFRQAAPGLPKRVPPYSRSPDSAEVLPPL